MEKIGILNWLEIATAVFLLLMMIRGYRKGFIRMVISVVAIIGTMFVVRTIMPQAAEFVRDKTSIYETVSQNLENVLSKEITEAMEGSGEGPFAEIEVIQKLNLPESIRKGLIENNKSEIYETLGVTRFSSYICGYLAELIIHAALYSLLFLAVYLASQLLVHILDLAARLPLISGVNKLAGAAVGLVQGVLYLWIASLSLIIFPNAAWAQTVMQKISESVFLTTLYNSNLLILAVSGLVKTFFQ